LVTSKIPVMTPINPCTSASCNAPCTKESPKLVIATVAPAPAKLTRGTYKPKPPKMAPVITKLVKVWAGDTLNMTYINCPMTQKSPTITNNQKKIIVFHPPSIQWKRHVQYMEWYFFVVHSLGNVKIQLQQKEFYSVLSLAYDLIYVHK